MTAQMNTPWSPRCVRLEETARTTGGRRAHRGARQGGVVASGAMCDMGSAWRSPRPRRRLAEPAMAAPA